jgi:hypothetical protein
MPVYCGVSRMILIPSSSFLLLKIRNNKVPVAGRHRETSKGEVKRISYIQSSFSPCTVSFATVA